MALTHIQRGFLYTAANSCGTKLAVMSTLAGATARILLANGALQSTVQHRVLVFCVCHHRKTSTLTVCMILQVISVKHTYMCIYNVLYYIDLLLSKYQV